MSKEFFILLISAAPVIELRGAIPLAVGLSFSPLEAYLLGVVGSSIPILPLLFFWKYGAEFLSKRFDLCKRFFTKLFEKVEVKNKKRFEVASFLALMIFVSIPLPGTGIWTGSIVAFVFKIPIKVAFFAILIGNLIAGIFVLLATLGVINVI